MTLCYDEAVKIGKKAYRTLEYSSSCVSAFKIASREFKEYMDYFNLPYTFELSQQWINDSKKDWKIHKLRSSRNALQVIADIMKHGCVTTSLHTKIERTPPYSQLPNWSRTLLDNYLVTISYSYGTFYLNQIRNACSCFLLFLVLRGISLLSEITHEVVKSFFTRGIHISLKTKDR